MVPKYLTCLYSALLNLSVASNDVLSHISRKRNQSQQDIKAVSEGDLLSNIDNV